MGVWTLGTSNRQVDDDTLELLARVSQPGATVTLDEDRTYRIRAVRVASGVTLVIPASTVIEIEDPGQPASNSLLIKDAADRVTITGEGTIRGTTLVRTAVYGLVRCGLSPVTIEGVTLHHSPSAAVWALGGSVRCGELTVYDTGADGIHLGRGVSDYEVSDCVIYDTNDDAIGIISYTAQGYPRCADGLIARNTITNVIVGRGISLSGCDTCTISDNTVAGTDQAGIIASGGVTGRSANVAVDGNAVSDTGRNVPQGGTGDGIYLTYTDGGSVTGNDISDIPANRVGIRLVDSLSTDLTESGNTFSDIASGTNVARG